GEKILAPTIPCLRKDGTTFYADICTTRLQLDGTECNAGFFTDVTDREQAKSALRESEKRFKKLSNLAFEGILIHDMGVVIDVNESLTKLLGYTREEMIGKNIVELCVPREYHATIRENIVKRYAKPYEVTARKKDGTLFPIELEARSITGKDEEFRVAAVRDITARKQAEQALRECDSRYRLLIEASGSGIILLDGEGNFLIVNDRAAETWGMRPEDLINRNVKEVLPPEFADEALSIIRKVSETGTGLEQERFIESIGKHFIENIQPVFNDKKELLGVQVLTFDITERKRAEDALVRRAEYERLISEVSSGLVGLGMDESDTCIEGALASIATFFRADRAYVFLFRDGDARMNNTHEWCAEGVEPQIGNLKNITVGDELPWFTERIHNGEVVHVPDVSTLPPEARLEREHFKAQDIQSLIVVPIASGCRLLGFLGFDSVRERRTWTDDDQALLRIIGESFAHLIERKRAEEALRESEDKYHSLIVNIPDVVWTSDQNGKTSFISENIEKVYGYTPEEIYQEADRLWFGRIHPDDVD
ncbi:MAG: PAS domain S-box protein, partial [bacterium]